MASRKLALSLFIFFLACGFVSSQPAFLGTHDQHQDYASSIRQVLGVQNISGNNSIRYSIDQKSGLARYIGSADISSPIDKNAGLNAKSPEEGARRFIGRLSSSFGTGNSTGDLLAFRIRPISVNRSLVRFTQMKDGIPVIGGEMAMQTDSENRVISAFSNIVTLGDVSTAPKLTSGEAAAIALEYTSSKYSQDYGSFSVSLPQLWLYNPTVFGLAQNQTFLVWRTSVSTNATFPPIDELVLVDSISGKVVLAFNTVDDALNRKVYDNANSLTKYVPSASGDLKRSEGQAATGLDQVDKAYDYLGDTYNFYKNLFGRDSLDNAGMNLVATVRYCQSGYSCPYPNAFWTPTYNQMVFGDGFVTDDVMGHELTHGVTSYEANLFYYMQSGSINEGLSDIFGEFVDLSNSAGNDTAAARWYLGEDLPGGPIRYMANPPAFGDPDRMNSSLYSCGTSDNGGVHTNSGVANKAAFLITDGGSFNGYNISGIGINRTAALFYESLTNLLTSASDYEDLGNSLEQAASNLNFNASERLTVEKTVNATQMLLQPQNCAADDAPICDVGRPAPIFFDNLENTSSGNWVSAALTGSNAWHYPAGVDNVYAKSGTNNFWADDLATISDSYMANARNITLPATGNITLMHFYQAFSFESNSACYDGGKLEYSINGSNTWNDAGGLIVNNNYTGTLATSDQNPLGGNRSFCMESNGYIATRLNLTSLDGSNIRFRFRIGTDNGNAGGAGIGWYIDDIRVYTCDAQAPAIRILAPQQNATLISQPNITFTATDSNLDRCWWTNDSGATNISLANCANITGITWPQGNTTVIVFANDTAGNINSSNVTFTLYTQAPTILFGNGTSASGFSRINVSVNLTAIQASAPLNYSILYVNGAPTIKACGGAFCNITATLSAEGNYTVYGWVNDSVNNSAATDVINYTIDKSAPRLSILLPLNNTYIKLPFQNMNYSSTDAYPASSWYSFDNSANASLAGNVSLTGLSEGNHNISIWANDSAGNMNYSFVSFTVDLIAPSLMVLGPQNGTVFNSQNPLAQLNVSINDSSPVTSWFVLNGVANYSSGNQTLSPMAGWNTIRVTANDSAGNSNTSQQFMFFFDLAAPKYSNISANATAHNRPASIFAYWTDNANLSNATLSTNNSGQWVNATMQLIGLSAWSNFTIITNSTNGNTVQWRVYASDFAGNTNATGIQSFATSNTAPRMSGNTFLSNYTPSASATINCTGGAYADDDGDSLAGTYYAWQRNGSAIAGASGPSLNISAQGITAGNNISCSVSLSDGIANSTFLSANATVGAAAPLDFPAYTAFNTSGTGRSNATIFYATWTDSLGAAFLSNATLSTNDTGAWQNVSENFSASSGWSNFSKVIGAANGTLIGWKVYASNQFGNTNSTSQGFLVARNTPPVISSASIAQAYAYRLDNISCGASGYYDADGDPAAAIYYRWYQNGTAVATGNSLSLEIIGARQSDSIICSTMPSDGYDNGSWVNSSALILLSDPAFPPAISSVFASTTSSTAAITWNTDSPCNSTLYVGTGIASLANVSSDSANVTAHTLTASSLSASTSYAYLISSCDRYGNCANSSYLQFTTSAASSGGSPSGSGGSSGSSGGYSGGGASYGVTSGAGAPSPSTPTPSAKPVAANFSREIDDNDKLDAQIGTVNSAFGLTFTAGSYGYDGGMEFTLPLNYSDYLSGLVKIRPAPSNVSKGSIIVRYDHVVLIPYEKFTINVTVARMLDRSIADQFTAPIFFRPESKPSATPAAIASPAIKPFSMQNGSQANHPQVAKLPDLPADVMIAGVAVAVLLGVAIAWAKKPKMPEQQA